MNENNGGRRRVETNGGSQNRAKGRHLYNDAPAKKKGKHRKLRMALLITLLVLVLIAAAGFIAYKVIVRAPDIPATDPSVDKTDANANVVDAPDVDITVAGARPDHRYTILICGTDVVADNTDSIMVVSYDVDNQKASVVSIPRDTLINVSWGIKKINAAYATGGIDQLKSELKKLLGFSIDYYVIVDKEAVVQLVDTIGGVDYEVPVNMYYDDPLQDLHISISKGMQHLDGLNAYKVLRYRQGNGGTGYVDGDIGRINTQQGLLMALASQTFTLSNITKVNSFVDIFNQYVETDLAVGELAWFAQNAMSLSSENLEFMTLPGNYNDSVKGLSYVTVNVSDLLTMVNTYLNPYDTTVTESNLDVITRDSSGNLYATTGSIRGGVESFSNYGYSSTPSYDEPEYTEPEVIEPVEPTPSDEPVEPTPSEEPTATDGPTEPTPSDEPTTEPTQPAEEPTAPVDEVPVPDGM